MPLQVSSSIFWQLEMSSGQYPTTHDSQVSPSATFSRQVLNEEYCSAHFISSVGADVSGTTGTATGAGVATGAAERGFVGATGAAVGGFVGSIGAAEGAGDGDGVSTALQSTGQPKEHVTTFKSSSPHDPQEVQPSMTVHAEVTSSHPRPLSGKAPKKQSPQLSISELISCNKQACMIWTSSGQS